MMYPEVQLPLALLLGHLLGDFVFPFGHETRPDASAARGRVMLTHGAVHGGATALSLVLFGPNTLSTGSLLACAVLLPLAHLGVDAAAVRASRRFEGRSGLLGLGIDQGVHLSVLGIVWIVLAREQAFALSRQVLAMVRENAPELLGVATVYAAVVFGGGPLVARALAPFEARLDTGSDEKAEELERAGLVIGWLERFLLITAVLAGSPTTAGLIIAAKSVFRFPEIEGRPFAEYFLIGTLLSVTLAVLGGLALRRLLLS